MKTLESIRDEIWEEMLWLEDKRIDQWVDIKYQTLREVLQKLGHLDEPEVLSQEWIDEHEIYYNHWVGAVPVPDLQNLLVTKQEEHQLVIQHQSDYIDKLVSQRNEVIGLLREYDCGQMTSEMLVSHLKICIKD